MSYRDVLPEPDEEFVVVHRPVDATEADIAAQILNDHGIGCRVVGTRAPALIGVAPSLTPLRLEVSSTRAADAREILAAMHAPPDDVAAAADDDDEPNLPRPKQAVLAVGCVLLVFGGSHLYAQRPWTAAVLGVTQLSTVLMLGKSEWPDAAIAPAAFVALLVVDALFGARAARAFNRGARPGALEQIVRGLGLVAVVAVVAAIAAAIAAV